MHAYGDTYTHPQAGTYTYLNIHTPPGGVRDRHIQATAYIFGQRQGRTSTGSDR